MSVHTHFFKKEPDARKRDGTILLLSSGTEMLVLGNEIKADLIAKEHMKENTCLDAAWPIYIGGSSQCFSVAILTVPSNLPYWMADWS